MRFLLLVFVFLFGTKLYAQPLIDSVHMLSLRVQKTEASFNANRTIFFSRPTETGSISFFVESKPATLSNSLFGVRQDTMGKVVWAKRYQAPVLGINPNSILKHSSGNSYLIMNSWSPPAAQENHLICIDPDGNLVFVKKLSTYNFVLESYMVELPSRNILIYSQAGPTAMAAKLSPAGVVMKTWSVPVATGIFENNSSPKDFWLLGNNRLVATGMTYGSTNFSSHYIMVADTNFAVKYAKRLEFGNQTWLGITCAKPNRIEIYANALGKATFLAFDSTLTLLSAKKLCIKGVSQSQSETFAIHGFHLGNETAVHLFARYPGQFSVGRLSFFAGGQVVRSVSVREQITTGLNNANNAGPGNFTTFLAKGNLLGMSGSYQTDFNFHRNFYQTNLRYGSNHLEGCNLPDTNLVLLDTLVPQPEDFFVGSVSVPVVATTVVNGYTAHDVPTCTLPFCQPPVFAGLGPDQFTCSDSVTLSVPKLYADQSTRWNTGDTALSIRVKVPGKYKVELLSLCAFHGDSIQISRSEASQWQIQELQPLCGTETDTLRISGMQGFTSCQWKDENGNVLSVQPKLPVSAGGLDNRKFYLLIQNGDCAFLDSTTVVWRKTPAQFLGSDIVTCKPDTILAVEDSVAGQFFQWTLPGGSTRTSRFVKASQTGDYILNFETTEGCPTADTIRVAFTGVLEGQLQAWFSDSLLADSLKGALPLQIRFRADSTGMDFSWLCAPVRTATNFPYEQLVTAATAGPVSCGVLYKDKAGCQYSAEKEIWVGSVEFPPIPERSIWIPNLVTQDGNDKNDSFFIRGLLPGDAHQLQLYNRWGKKVLETQNYMQNWPPKNQSPGNYYFVFQWLGKTYNGWVNLVK